jgi:hypothetical protein
MHHWAFTLAWSNADRHVANRNATSGLIRAEESRTRARLNRLEREGKIERKPD